MFRTVLFVPALWCLAAPVYSEDFRTIGQIEAVFDGETLSQTTVSYLEDGQRLGTASLSQVMGMTSLTIQGAEGNPITIEAMFAAPDLKGDPVHLAVGYFPSGMRSHWTSEDAPEPARIRFEGLETTGDSPHTSGTFEALLCEVPEGAYEADIDMCHAIAGRFDTGLIRE